MPEITEQRLRDLCNNPPPGAVHWEWETLVGYLARETDSSDAYVLNLMLADLDARTAKAREVPFRERPPVESRQGVDTREGRWVEVPVPGKTVLVMAKTLPATLAERRDGFRRVRIEYAVLDDDGGDEPKPATEPAEILHEMEFDRR